VRGTSSEDDGGERHYSTVLSTVRITSVNLHQHNQRYTVAERTGNTVTTMSNDNNNSETEGSWVPFIIVSILLCLWWASSSQSSGALRLRRWYNMQVCCTLLYSVLVRRVNLLLFSTLWHKYSDDFVVCVFVDHHLQRVQLKKKLGLRDESIYRDGAAGDGANQRHKRQG